MQIWTELQGCLGDLTWFIVKVKHMSSINRNPHANLWVWKDTGAFELLDLLGWSGEAIADRNSDGWVVVRYYVLSWADSLDWSILDFRSVFWKSLGIIDSRYGVLGPYCIK